MKTIQGVNKEEIMMMTHRVADVLHHGRDRERDGVETLPSRGEQPEAERGIYEEDRQQGPAVVLPGWGAQG